jgi:glycosyltransferase involved in cell wall biosynthesis
LDREFVLLARALAKAGAEVHVFCNPNARTLEAADIVFHDLRALQTGAQGRFRQPLNILSFATAATRALRREGPEYDLVHVSGLWAWKHDVVTVHSVTSAEQWRWVEWSGYRAAHLRALLAPVLWPRIGLLRWIERRQLRPGAYLRLIARTPGVQRDLEQVYRVPTDRIDFIPYPITVNPSAQGEGGWSWESLGIAPDTPILLFVGHDFERKGLLEAIEALAGLEPEAHLVVVGSDDRAPYSAAAGRLGVAHRVHFVGGTTSPEPFYREADVLVHPARQETWGIILLEAMALGLPVVTTKATGSAGEIEAAQAGVVLPDASPTVLRHTLSALLRDSDRRRDMGARGRVAAARFLPDSLAQKTLETYRRAVQDRADRRS